MVDKVRVFLKHILKETFSVLRGYAGLAQDMPSAKEDKKTGRFLTG